MPLSLGQAFSFDQMLPARPAAGDLASERQTRVIVIGAGLAGLSCGFRLAEGGSTPPTPADVLVLEREAHVGGRTRSLAVGEATVNLGAVTFQPHHYPRYMALLADLGLTDRIRPVHRRDMVLGHNQRAARADNVALAWDGVKGLVGQGVFTPPEALQLLRFYFFLQRVTGANGEAELMSLHALSVGEWARRFGFGPGLLRKFVETFSGFCFQSPENFSAAFGIFLLGFNLSHPATLKGGLGQVPEAMAQRLAGCVETGAAALEVQRETDGFSVVYQQASRLHRVRSRALVIAVPASVAARLVPEMRSKAGGVPYGTGSATLLAGKLKQPFALHLRRIDGPAGTTILGGEACVDGGRHILNVLSYRGQFEPDHAATFMAHENLEVLGEYRLCPAVAAPAPGQTPLPIEWGDGLYLAGDCTGLFPSQEAAVSSGEQVARRLQDA